ncbi:MAG: MBL fold metallo-hydrolase [Chloroflexi bacterium]|nr:MBL fold metallo-hydrolase [Chloroflexota bacterium]
MNYVHIALPAGNENIELEHGSLFFVGTATVILRYAGFTVLTDPNFLHQGEHIHVGYGLRAERLTNPAIGIGALPALDLVVLSHMHEDHFDHVATRKLNKMTPIVTTPQAAKVLKKKRFRITYPLNTWETLTMLKGENQLRITALPAKHAPGILTHMLPPVMGSMLEFETAAGERLLRLYISGDTLFHKSLKEIPERYSDIDLALLHLGGTKILGVMLTMDGEQGVEAIKLLNPHEAVPIHFNDYNVFKSPLDDFRKAVAAAGLEQRVRYLRHGQTYTFTVPESRRRKITEGVSQSDRTI